MANKVFYMDIDSQKKANNKIECVEINYLNNNIISNKIVERRERIYLDGKKQLLLIEQNYSNCKTTKEYYIPNDIDSLLCQFEKAINEEYFIQDQNYPKYQISILYKNGKKLEYEAGFNRAELPTFWEDFSYELLEIIKHHGVFGDMLDFNIYGKGNKKDEYIYCSVIFENNIGPYYYRTDDNSLEIGDKVLVPFGSKENIGRISNIEYFKKEDVPIPLNIIKSIIKKINKNISFTQI